MNRILIVDDEQSILETLSLILGHAGYAVETCSEGFTAIDLVMENNYDLVLLDIKMPRMDGLEVLERIIAINPDLVIIMISGHGNIETAVESTKKGAYFFLEKPLPDISELLLTIKNAIQHKQSIEELHRLKKKLIETNRIIGNSKEITDVKSLITRYSNLDLNVLITGESGTGKMLVAHQMHLQSLRSVKPFVIINCATLTDNKADEELFGLHDGRNIRIKGKLTETEGGTLLFDEISNLSFEVQSKILKVIEEGRFVRVGQINEIKTDIRFMFSTNNDLELEIKEGRFREDLYHRINVLRIDIAPLRQRIGDVDELINFFTDEICRIYNVKQREFSMLAVQKLKSLRWPGNVRELRNLIERIIFSVDNDIIEEEDIDLPGSRQSKELTDLMNKDLSLNDFQNESEKLFLLKMLNDYKYNISQTAEALKIQRSHLYKLMGKYDIPTPSKIR